MPGGKTWGRKVTKSRPPLAERIRAAREAAGLTQRELAGKMGLSHVTIANWEGGRQEPSLDKIERLAAILGVTTSELGFGRSAPGARVLPLLQPGHLAGRVSDAPPDQPSETITVTSEEARCADAVVILQGDSMEPHFIEGDVVGIRRQSTAAVGDYVVARLPEGDLTFKRFGGKNQQGIILLPSNPDYQPIIEPYAEILGVYRWLRRQASEPERR